MSIIRDYRSALQDIEGQEGMFVEVGIFKGTKENCDKVGVVTDLIKYFQTHLPKAKLETFVVPIPEDEQAASVVRDSMINNVHSVFDSQIPMKKELN